MRILDSSNIKYSQYEYEANQSLTGEEIASILHEDVNSVFKTLITKGKSNDYYAFMIPVNKELDLKKAAKTVCEKSVEMIPFKDLLKITGYVHGGCSPLGLKKDYQVSIDESVLALEELYFSGGKVGVQVKVKVDDFLNLAHPKIANLVK
ncbi:MAG: YbaK/EbsC family protein [Candidatus Onthovivens sp.]|nr:YbaK/EbsC family protein [Candidatus Onthovivens sp.]